jgi:hypothetical protein
VRNSTHVGELHALHAAVFKKLRVEGLAGVKADVCEGSAYIAYDLWARGPIPERRLNLDRLGVIDPMKDLSALGEVARVSMLVGSDTLDNLLIAKANLRNVGKAPILPTDYHEKISVNVEPPWKIVSINNSADDSPRRVDFKWSRISETQFEAEPALLNPGDHVSTVVYVTNTQASRSASSVQKLSEKDVDWKARITNLSEFVEEPETPYKVLPRGILVHVSGWALPFMLAAALVFQALYLHLLQRTRLLSFTDFSGVTWVLATSLLSFAAAESMADFLFPPGDIFEMLFDLLAPKWINALCLTLHRATLLGLWLKGRRAIRAPPAAPW